MGKAESDVLENVKFLFLVDGVDSRVNGLMAYGSAIRTSSDGSEAAPRVTSCASATVRWMTIYSDDGSGPEHHALVWHNACFAF